MLDMSAWGDDKGFAYVNFGEHHVSETGYNPSPLVTCAAMPAEPIGFGYVPMCC